MGKIKFVLPPTQKKPNSNQWKIGCVGSPSQNVCVGHVHFMLFVLIPYSTANWVCSGIWDLNYFYAEIYVKKKSDNKQPALKYSNTNCQ